MSSIREPSAADAHRLAALSADLGYPTSADSITRRLRSLLERNDHCLRLAESPNGETLGWIHAHEQCALEAGPWCEIVGLVVDGRHRGEGVGRALVVAVESWARDRGLVTLKVRSNVLRDESHPFYQHLGFDRIKSQHVYRKPLK